MSLSITENELRGGLLRLQQPDGWAKYYYLDAKWGIVPDGWDTEGNFRPRPIATSGKLGWGQPVISPLTQVCEQFKVDTDTVFEAVRDMYPGQATSPRTQALVDRANRVLTDHLQPDGQIDDTDAFSQDIRRAKAQRLTRRMHAQGAFANGRDTINRLTQDDSHLPELVRLGNQILADYMDELGVVKHEQEQEFKSAIAAVVRGAAYLGRDRDVTEEEDESADRPLEYRFDDRSHRFFNHRS